MCGPSAFSLPFPDNQFTPPSLPRNETQFIKDEGAIGVDQGELTDFSTFPPATLDAMKEGVKAGYTFLYDPDNAAKFAGTDKLAEGM